MDYLVVAPHTPFYHWQISLLLQSFRGHGMEENLVILLLSDSSPQHSTFYNSFGNHSRLHIMRFACDQHPEILRANGIRHAVNAGLVTSPFVFIPPWCLLRSPMARPQANITFSFSADFDFPRLDTFGISSDAIQRRMHNQRRWLPTGEIVAFDEVGDDFFNKVVSHAELLAFDSIRDGLKKGEEDYPRALCRAGIAFTALESSQRYTFDTTRHLECTLKEHDANANFINYFYGYPPSFSRCFYPGSGDQLMAYGSPFQGMLDLPANHATNFLKQVVASMVIFAPVASF